MRAWFQQLRQKRKHLFCLIVNGKHELYPAFSETRIFQQCLLCQYETPGWTIDRRDRQRVLTFPRQKRVA